MADCSISGEPVGFKAKDGVREVKARMGVRNSELVSHLLPAPMRCKVIDGFLLQKSLGGSFCNPLLSVECGSVRDHREESLRPRSVPDEVRG
ncbi:hypothetical protein L2E82_05199 [Cichorium intybus]|uniref:Uncharacterized protein n=1 Tax=Cichorium intybus TaxID=13427 RepID=A0ACB9H6S0_CICIN|nr:hypothetical protein L2E82_05199 [Cichorium intybus]